MSKVEDIVVFMAEPIVREAGMELVDVEFVKEGAHWYLRVFIDKPGGVDIDDCQEISNKLSPELDERDPVPQEYMLEVSSPGLERPLKKPADFERYKGHKVRVTTYAPVNGKKEFVGELVGLADGQILLKDGEAEITIAKEKASRVRLEIEF